MKYMSRYGFNVDIEYNENKIILSAYKIIDEDKAYNIMQDFVDDYKDFFIGNKIDESYQIDMYRYYGKIKEKV